MPVRQSEVKKISCLWDEASIYWTDMPMEYNRQIIMKRQFLFIVAMIAMVFMACEEEKENVNNSSNSSSKKETTYSIKNYTNSTITDIKV